MKLLGRSGASELIDVLWELMAANGSPQHVIIEHRRYGKPLENHGCFTVASGERRQHPPAGLPVGQDAGHL
ncbi:hypothetical protein AB0C96_36455 [Streptomyces sp. NPDC048506]|uniref:hypothetical protein n=1 Tax=Streptomyces sp. NPDC048506 TaxID=3155028 RepID=UPI00342D40AF